MQKNLLDMIYLFMYSSLFLCYTKKRQQTLNFASKSGNVHTKVDKLIYQLGNLPLIPLLLHKNHHMTYLLDDVTNFLTHLSCPWVCDVIYKHSLTELVQQIWS
jgi:hypothetical protein